MLIMYSAIESIRKDVIDAARNLGAGRMKTLFHVIIPLSLPSALGRRDHGIYSDL